MTRTEKMQKLAEFVIEGMDLETIEVIATNSLINDYKGLSEIKFKNLYEEYFEDEE